MAPEGATPPLSSSSSGLWRPVRANGSARGEVVQIGAAAVSSLAQADAAPGLESIRLLSSKKSENHVLATVFGRQGPGGGPAVVTSRGSLAQTDRPRRSLSRRTSPTAVVAFGMIQARASALEILATRYVDYVLSVPHKRSRINGASLIYKESAAQPADSSLSQGSH